MRILAISGSLRAASINSALLRASAHIAPPDIEVTLCTVAGALPLFNPDQEHQMPPSVVRLYAEVSNADALLIASVATRLKCRVCAKSSLCSARRCLCPCRGMGKDSNAAMCSEDKCKPAVVPCRDTRPEYAHGVSGTVKNLLDWLVSFEPFVNKPVAIINTSPRAHHADAALRETLKTMSALIVEEASVSIHLLGARLNEEGMLASPTVTQPLRSAFTALQHAVAQQNTLRTVTA